ncbi:M4 family metallopeptidase [Variovorax sp. J22G73]|uniref:M4 family metallopeptidase n=1 Tax=unclassified Variovorax TaxID=663243 RepID=UPI000D5D3462|nr:MULTISPECIES: M4 family metallopeptidase [unclassified Variovorax]MDM0009607.1 M4 family metallopeptidase [Variovorax sp. J22R203]MDM0102115.1 M4 family metallopeptidase [Variovorax sp. J22G73]
MKTRLRILVVAVLTVAGHSAFAAEADRQAAIDRALALIQTNPSNFNVAPPPAASPSPSPSHSPAPSGRSMASSAAAPPALPGSGDQFKARDVIVDKDGTEHVRFDRYHDGLRVIGGDVVVHSSQGRLLPPDLTQKSAIRLPETLGKVGGRTVIQNAPDIGAERAKSIAAQSFASAVLRYGTPELVVFARDETPVLAYAVRVYGRATAAHGSAVVYYVDARDGKLLDAEDLVHTAATTGTGKSLYYGDLQIATDQTGNNAYRMVDPTRGGGEVIDGRDSVASDLGDSPDLVPFTSPDNKWGNGATTDRKTVAVDINYGLAKTWDYYKDTHGRNGIFNDGKGVQSYAHVQFLNPDGSTTGANAAWLSEGRMMAYGDGEAGTSLPKPVVSIDVAGHEMSHGVNQATANLAYSRDAGGLNEANSDIFGTLVKFYANNVNDPGNYVIGARILPGGLRKMYKQDVDGRSSVCYPQGGFKSTQTNPRHDPHLSSGVGNRFFYLLAEGAVVPAGESRLTKSDLVCNGDTGLAGIGRDKAGRIWYRTLTVYLNSSSTYPNARAASIRAATDLYGANSAEQAAVTRAWSAVSVQ